MTDLEKYARAVADQYSIDGFSIKGHGHESRCLVSLSPHSLQRFLPHVTVYTGKRVSRRKAGPYKSFTSQAYYRSYAQQLLAAGINLGENKIVFPDRWAFAWSVFRMTGEPLAAARKEFGINQRTTDHGQPTIL